MAKDLLNLLPWWHRQSQRNWRANQEKHCRNLLLTKKNQAAARVLRYDWRLPVYLAAIFGALSIVVSNDLVQVLAFFLLAPAFALILIALLLHAALRRRTSSLSLAGAIGVFFLCSAALVAYERDDPRCIRSAVRWTLLCQHYKAQILAQKQPRDGTLKHIE